MDAFIECEAGSKTKRWYDERTFVERRSAELPAAYPFAYGFIPGTGAGGDCLDCFVVTARNLPRGSLVTCEPLATLEFFEGDELDYKVFARLVGDEVALAERDVDAVKAFIGVIFADLPHIAVGFGSVLSATETAALVEHRRAATPPGPSQTEPNGRS